MKFETMPENKMAQGSTENVSDEEKKKESSTEDKIGKIDEIFDELLDKVKDAPEAKQKALQILIQQMQQIGDQMKQVRDMKHFQEMKKLMMQHWKELEELAGGDPELLKTIQDWGKKFVDSKVIYYELVGDVKDELIDKAQEIQECWDDMVAEIGAITGLVAFSEWDITEILNGGGLIVKNFRTGIEDVMNNITDPESHYFTEGLPIKEANEFLSRISAVIFKLSKEIEDFNIGMPPYIPERVEMKKRAQGFLEKLIENKKMISRGIKDASKIFRVIKKVRDTHFLPLYNEQPEQIAA